MSESNPDYESALEYEIFDQGNVVSALSIFLKRQISGYTNSI